MPALSLASCNSSMAEEVWNVVSLFPYETRFALYASWKSATTGTTRHLELKTAIQAVEKKTRGVFQRLCLNNVKTFARSIGKICSTNPLIFFMRMFEKVENMRNFIDPIVESLKYCTALAFDVLNFCIIDSISNPKKIRRRDTDVFTRCELINESL